MTSRSAAAARIVALLDSPFLRALTEPARLEVLRVLIIKGPSDIAEIASELPQDRSVISRHLKVLEEAGIVRAERDGRHRIFALEAAGFIVPLERILSETKALAPICCPPSTRAPAPRGKSKPLPK